MDGYLGTRQRKVAFRCSPKLVFPLSTWPRMPTFTFNIRFCVELIVWREGPLAGNYWTAMEFSRYDVLRTNRQRTKSASVFGQIRWNLISGQWSLLFICSKKGRKSPANIRFSKSSKKNSAWVQTSVLQMVINIKWVKYIKYQITTCIVTVRDCVGSFSGVSAYIAPRMVIKSW